MESQANYLEKSMLATIAQCNLPLTLHKSIGIIQDDWMNQSKMPVYRLRSTEYTAYVDVILDTEQHLANVLMCHIYPSNTFWRLKEFFMGQCMRVLFEGDSNLKVIAAIPSRNDLPCKKRRTSADLQRLWLLVGFQKHAGGIFLTRENWKGR